MPEWGGQEEGQEHGDGCAHLASFTGNTQTGNYGYQQLYPHQGIFCSILSLLSHFSTSVVQSKSLLNNEDNICTYFKHFKVLANYKNQELAQFMARQALGKIWQTWTGTNNFHSSAKLKITTRKSLRVWCSYQFLTCLGVSFSASQSLARILQSLSMVIPR